MEQDKLDAVEEKLEREAAAAAAAAAAAKAVEDERDKLPPYLPSIYGCRSVEEFHVRKQQKSHSIEFNSKYYILPPDFSF